MFNCVYVAAIFTSNRRCAFTDVHACVYGTGRYLLDAASIVFDIGGEATLMKTRVYVVRGVGAFFSVDESALLFSANNYLSVSFQSSAKEARDRKRHHT